MKNYTIFIRDDNNHVRTINTPMMGRTNYSTIVVKGKQELEAKISELKNNHVKITEICTDLGTRIIF